LIITWPSSYLIIGRRAIENVQWKRPDTRKKKFGFFYTKRRIEIVP
jgi:hypothetical protein